MKNPLYVLTVAALTLSLAGCAAGTGTASDASGATSSATKTPAAEPVVDPLERLPEQPFGIDVNAIAAAPPAAGVTWQTGTDQLNVPVTGAIQTFLQIIWAGNERQVLTGGPDIEKVQGAMKDLEYFVASVVIEEARAGAMPGLEFAQKVKAEGDSVELERDRALWYPLHLGLVASPSTDDPAQIEKRSSQWPDIKEGDPVGWASIDGEEDEVPFKTGARTELIPKITNVYDAEEDSTSDVQIRANLTYDVALMDGRTLQITYPTWYRMTYQDGSWKAAGWSYVVGEPTSVIKK